MRIHVVSKNNVNPVNHSQRKQRYSDLTGYEVGLFDEIIRSRRTAWRVTGCSILLALMVGGTSFVSYMKPPPDPLVIRVSDTSGSVERVTSLTEHPITEKEAVNKYFINQYVINRESYNYFNQQVYYDNTTLWSSPSEQKKYSDFWLDKDSPVNNWKDSKTITVQVRSIQLSSDNHATVRFQSQVNDSTGSPISIENRIVVINFSYINLPMDELTRRVNPLGFQVNAYQVDIEKSFN